MMKKEIFRILFFQLFFIYTRQDILYLNSQNKKEGDGSEENPFNDLRILFNTVENVSTNNITIMLQNGNQILSIENFFILTKNIKIM